MRGGDSPGDPIRVPPERRLRSSGQSGVLEVTIRVLKFFRDAQRGKFVESGVRGSVGCATSRVTSEPLVMEAAT
jgi:hypothetical protein